MKIGFIGMGVVGGATAKVLGNAHEIYPYDKYIEEYQDIESLAKNAEVIFLCVPTPMRQSGEIDYSTVYKSMELLLEKVKEAGRDPIDVLIVIRSTAVSGTTDKLTEKFPFRIAFNPEFLREKHSLEDMQNLKRVVIGANRIEDYETIVSVYKPVFPEAKFIHVDRKTAEMVKYAANVTLTGQIAIANEIYQICQALEVDYDVVKRTILLDERIGNNINVPGPDGDLGFGGKCFPKDLNALIYLSRENMHRPYLLEEIWRLNERVRKNKDWLDITGATSQNTFKEKKDLT